MTAKAAAGFTLRTHKGIERGGGLLPALGAALLLAGIAGQVCSAMGMPVDGLLLLAGMAAAVCAAALTGRRDRLALLPLGVLLAAAKGMELPVVELTAENVREQRKQIEFDAAFGGERLKGLTVSLCGRHQADNACAALGALLALALAGWVSAALPWLMSAAAGCMVCVTAQEMIPEAVEQDEPAGVISVVLGFALMMALDIAL